MSTTETRASITNCSLVLIRSSHNKIVGIGNTCCLTYFLYSSRLDTKTDIIVKKGLKKRFDIKICEQELDVAKKNLSLLTKQRIPDFFFFSYIIKLFPCCKFIIFSSFLIIFHIHICLASLDYLSVRKNRNVEENIGKNYAMLCDRDNDEFYEALGTRGYTMTDMLVCDLIEDSEFKE